MLDKKHAFFYSVYIEYILYILYTQRCHMDIVISNASEKPIYEQISSQIKALIMNGTLKEGEMLPSIRVIAKELKVSVITTKRAYSDLERDGFIEVVQGRGSFVSSRNLDFIREEQLKQAENHLIQAASIAQSSNISLEELIEMLTIIYEGD